MHDRFSGASMRAHFILWLPLFWSSLIIIFNFDADLFARNNQLTPLLTAVNSFFFIY